MFAAYLSTMLWFWVHFKVTQQRFVDHYWCRLGDELCSLFRGETTSQSVCSSVCKQAVISAQTPARLHA